jgi:glycosyltransferase involved in cell wall biosynthesis
VTEADKKRMRIVMIGDFPRDSDSIGGGVESVMTYLCKALGSEPDIQVDVVTLDRWGLGDRVSRYPTYTAHYVSQSTLRGPAKRAANIRRLLRKLSVLDPDLVHAQIAGQYAAAAHRHGKPWVLTLHGVRFLEANLKTGFVDRLYRRHVTAFEERASIRNAENVISINPFIDECFRSELHGRVENIENPVADSWFEIVEPGDRFGMLYAGRITPRKDILTLLDSFRLVHSRHPEFTLRIAGAPDNPDPQGYFDQVQASVIDNGLEYAVEFLGNLSEAELHAEYARNSIFVIAAVLETAPMSIAQAQAAGRMIVATDAGGCRHMISDGESGLIVPIGDIGALANALLKCVEAPATVERMREKTRHVAERRFRAKSIATKTVALYREILGESS